MKSQNQVVIKLIKSFHDFTEEELKFLIEIIGSESSRSTLLNALESLANLHKSSNELIVKRSPEPSNSGVKNLRSKLYKFASDRSNFPSNQDLVDAILLEFDSINFPPSASKESRSKILSILWNHLSTMNQSQISDKLTKFVKKYNNGNDEDYQLLFKMLTRRE